MSNNAGLVSQYGFLFQKTFYQYLLLKDLNRYDVLIFEGVDDVEEQYTQDDIIALKNSNCYIQVKTGNISEEIMFKVLGNWMKLDETIEKYILVTENSINLNMDEHFVEKFVKNVEDSKDCRNTKILKQVYLKYLDKGIFDKELVKKELIDLIKIVEIDEKSFVDIKKELQELFINNYTSHIKIFNELKLKCFNQFIDKINRVIDGNIALKQPTRITKQDINEYIIDISSSISDNKYNIDIEEFKERVKPKVAEIIKNSTLREIEQLKYVNTDEKFIIRHITNKLLYDDFRAVYDGNLNTSIKNIEYTAFDNYLEVLECLPDEECTPRNIFNKTLATPILDDLLPANNSYYKGCYIYLTGESAPLNKRISWRIENEEN